MTATAGLSDAFLDAVIDTLLPGEAAGEHPRPLPPASRLGLRGRLHAAGHGEVFARIAETAGGEAAFIAADADRREAILVRVESGAFGAFRGLVNAVLADYYEHPEVLACFGRRATPPQPEGNQVAGPDAEMAAALERVRARGPIWRG